MNTQSVYFGTIVIGEKLTRKIQLINKGALGTNFKLMDLKEFKNSSNDDSENLQEDGIKMGDVREGFIAPFATVDLEFSFSPSFPGKFQEDFVIKFDDENSKEVIQKKS